MKKYRFFYHYRKETGGMTVHFRKKCYAVENVNCKVACETKFNKQQPRLVMQGFAESVEIENETATIK